MENKEIKKILGEKFSEIQKKMEQIQRKMSGKELIESEEILNRKVIKTGNSGRIAVPAKHIGKDARVIILRGNIKTKKEEDIKKS